MRTKFLLLEYPKEVPSFGTEFPIETSVILVGIRFFSGKFSVFISLLPAGTGRG